MPDYSDISAAEFVRFEKIRSRFSDIVTDLDLVTNSTPSVLQIDPVLVVYDLAAGSGSVPELSLETPSFQREVIGADFTLSSGSGPQTLPFISAGGPFSDTIGRVERILGFDLEIDASATTSTGVQLDFVVQQAATGFDVSALIVENVDNDIQRWSVQTEGTGITVQEWGKDPFGGIVVGLTQEIVLRVDVIGAATLDGDVDVSYSVLYEYRIE